MLLKSSKDVRDRVGYHGKQSRGSHCLMGSPMGAPAINRKRMPLLLSACTCNPARACENPAQQVKLKLYLLSADYEANVACSSGAWQGPQAVQGEHQAQTAPRC